MSKRYVITFLDVVEHESMDECIEEFLEYLKECVEMGDVAGFGIEEEDDE